jgi:hypothetical protein
MRAEKSVGSASASSNAFVCSDCVPPSAAASASTHVRATLLNGSCAARLHPDVWQWVRSVSDFGFFAPNPETTRDHSSRAARSFATSMK